MEQVLVSDLLSSTPSTVVPAPTGAVMEESISDFHWVCITVLSSIQIQVRRRCSTSVPRFGAFPFNEVQIRRVLVGSMLNTDMGMDNRLITKNPVRNTGLCSVGMPRKSRFAPNKDLGMAFDRNTSVIVLNTVQFLCRLCKLGSAPISQCLLIQILVAEMGSVFCVGAGVVLPTVRCYAVGYAGVGLPG